MTKVIYDTFDDAVVAAHRKARTVFKERAYAVRWPLGHCTTEYVAPVLRDPLMKVVCCTADGREELV